MNSCDKKSCQICIANKNVWFFFWSVIGVFLYTSEFRCKFNIVILFCDMLRAMILQRIQSTRCLSYGTYVFFFEGSAEGKRIPNLIHSFVHLALKDLIVYKGYNF